MLWGGFFRGFSHLEKHFADDGRGYLPNGSDIKFVNGGGGRPPFLEHIDYLDRQIVIAATGGLLTMLAEPGSGTLAGGCAYGDIHADRPERCGDPKRGTAAGH